MLTRAQVLEAVAAGRPSFCVDHRDYTRLCNFFPVSDWHVFGFKPPERPVLPRPWTEDEVLSQLALDVEFGIEKAHGQRGISATAMYEVVRMWMWVLGDEELAAGMPYTEDYGLKYFEAVQREHLSGRERSPEGRQDSRKFNSCSDQCIPPEESARDVISRVAQSEGWDSSQIIDRLCAYIDYRHHVLSRPLAEWLPIPYTPEGCVELAGAVTDSWTDEDLRIFVFETLRDQYASDVAKFREHRASMADEMDRTMEGGGQDLRQWCQPPSSEECEAGCECQPPEEG